MVFSTRHGRSGGRVGWMRLGRWAEMGMQGEDQGKSRWASERKEEGEEGDVTI
jgi:hypothetical protein